jgi:hypothetical protein
VAGALLAWERLRPDTEPVAFDRQRYGFGPWAQRRPRG